MKYEVLKIQLLFLSTPESQLLLESRGCQHLDSPGSDSLCCQLWKELICILSCSECCLSSQDLSSFWPSAEFPWLLECWGVSPFPMHLINPFLTADRSWGIISPRVLPLRCQGGSQGRLKQLSWSFQGRWAQLEWDLQPVLRQGGHQTLQHPTGRHLISWTIL